MHLVRLLTVAEIHEVEAVDKGRIRKVSRGNWASFLAAAPALDAFGPRLPLYSEAVHGLSDDELTLERMRRIYRPSPSVVHWITQHVDSASHEEDRHASLDFGCLGLHELEPVRLSLVFSFTLHFWVAL